MAQFLLTALSHIFQTLYANKNTQEALSNDENIIHNIRNHPKHKMAQHALQHKSQLSQEKQKQIITQDEDELDKESIKAQAGSIKAYKEKPPQQKTEIKPETASTIAQQNDNNNKDIILINQLVFNETSKTTKDDNGIKYQSILKTNENELNKPSPIIQRVFDYNPKNSEIINKLKTLFSGINSTIKKTHNYIEKYQKDQTRKTKMFNYLTDIKKQLEVLYQILYECMLKRECDPSDFIIFLKCFQSIHNLLTIIYKNIHNDQVVDNIIINKYINIININQINRGNIVSKVKEITTNILNQESMLNKFISTTINEDMWDEGYKKDLRVTLDEFDNGLPERTKRLELQTLLSSIVDIIAKITPDLDSTNKEHSEILNYLKNIENTLNELYITSCLYIGQEDDAFAHNILYEYFQLVKYLLYTLYKNKNNNQIVNSIIRNTNNIRNGIYIEDIISETLKMIDSIVKNINEIKEIGGIVNYTEIVQIHIVCKYSSYKEKIRWLQLLIKRDNRKLNDLEKKLSELLKQK